MLSPQLCLTLCDPMDCSLPGSSMDGVGFHLITMCQIHGNPKVGGGGGVGGELPACQNC